MRSNYLKATMKTAVLAVTILLLGVSVALAQTSVNLTAAPQHALLPDGQSVPMWGLVCSGGPCTSLHYGSGAYDPQLGGDAWQPPLIIVPAGNSLTINLTNQLPGAVPTSLVIVGQLGGGLGDIAERKTDPSPNHPPQSLTWPVGANDATNTPPSQEPRVRSFSTEVTTGATKVLTWSSLRPGTYLIESGTHPSIQGPMGLYGIVVVTTAPAGATAGTAYPAQAAAGGIPAIAAVTYNADLPLLLSEIDPVQNTAVNTAVNTAGFSETKVWSGQAPDGCGYPGLNPAIPTNPTFNTCYPPAVNYSPLYYLINGVGFSRASSGASVFSAAPSSGVAGNVLVRMVNAGLRMHVPSIVGSLTGASGSAGFGLMAEDGNPLPGLTRVQSEVFMAAGKTYDVLMNVPAAGSTALPIFDRALGLSANATARDAGMLAYLGVNGSGAPAAASFGAAAANPDTYNSLISGQTLVISDPAKGVLANDVNVTGAKVAGAVTGGTLTLNSNGTFSFAATAGTGSFTYCGNGTTSGAACTTVTLGAAPMEANTGITCSGPFTFSSNVATTLSIKPPGVLASCKDAAGYPLTVGASSGAGVTVDGNGGFTAKVASHSGPATATFTFQPKNSQGTLSAITYTATVNFPAPSGLVVNLIDGSTKQPLGDPATLDYRWIIEEDRTFFIDPKCQTNPLPTGCPGAGGSVVPTFGVNFHSSYMPVVAQGCTGPISCESGQTMLDPATGAHVNAVCDEGNGVCHPGAAKTPLFPGDVALDPTKHYYISILPGDAVGVDGAGQDTPTSHQMGGGQIGLAQTAVNVIVEPQNQQASKMSVFVFRDDHPLNGEHDAGGGLDVLSPNEPGLGGFNITIFDDVGGTGDAAGQMTYDEFGQPLSNALAGTVDPVTGADACPVSANPRTGFDGATSDTGITSMITVCPNYEADGTTLSPLAGQAVVVNMPPGRYGIVATPGADRISMGEEWLQTNTLDGGKAHDAFLKIGEPSFFQEFGPAGYHVAIGFANPAFINAVGRDLCTGTGALQCTHTVSGKVTGVHMSRPADERLYGTGTRDTFGYSQCYASLGSVDGADFTFAKCADDGTFTLQGVPTGDWRLTIFDQWNDQIVDGISTPVTVGAGNKNLGEIAVHAWKQNLYTRTCFDVGSGPGTAGYADGVCQGDEPGLSLVPTNIRFRDGSVSNFNSTDLEGNAGFNEVFPLFNWYMLETDSNRYKNTGTHVINDAGGPTDGTASCGQPGFPACGTSTNYLNMARTHEDNPLPTTLQFPGSRYCGNADCAVGDSAGGSTGRVDPPWVTSYGWQGFAGQNQFVEFGKIPFAENENGGIRGHVVYASTRPFDDPSLLLQLSWEPMVPHVTINLYQKGTAPDGSSSLKLVDTTTTSSWDDWAQGFWPGTNKPYMSCPGQDPLGTFMFTLKDQPNYLNPGTTIPNNSQFKCYDGMQNWVQLQPAPYDGMYQFPSIAGRNTTTGVPVGGTGSVAGTNCSICVANPTDGTPMLPAGRYVVEMIVPPGYELVKEEDKNILLGDAYEGPVTTQFAGFGNIFIMPDQASLAAYNPNNPLIPSTDEGVTPRHEGDTGSVETFWPCVGASRIVPDFMSLFPGSGQNAPFAGAKRNLCDRKEVILEDQMSVLAKFYVFTSTHVAGHFTGIITDDFTSEFDPFSPHFGEKFSPANLPVGVKDFAGNEVARVYSDWWGIYNGLNYATFSVNPPDPSGYIPTMMVMCMNDRGTATAYDPFYQEAYSQFCYELPFMPGQTGYFDTPVIPTTAFAEGYNHPDCAYPDATPAISEVDGDGVGPWISAAGSAHPITIHALGDQTVNNYGFSGPVVSTAPYNQKTVVRHYGFGSQGPGSSVTIGGVAAIVVSWSDDTIVVTVPATGNGQVPTCSMQQQAQFGGSTARCGQVVVKADNGKQSIDTITVTVGGKIPTHVGATESIQAAIDNASPGDLIIIDPTCKATANGAAGACSSTSLKSSATHSELLIMWKPVRLQGVGAASTIINADAHPSGKLAPWRKQVVCLFGLGEDGRPESWLPSCGAGWNFYRANASNPQVDRLPFESTVGWDATLNGNLAEQLQEPSLMGAYEGAAITILAKGVRFPAGAAPDAEAGFPDGTALLTSQPNNNNCGSGTNPNGNNRNRFPSSFQCNPSRIDGLTIANSSQGGGGIFAHAWAHNLEISNNRITNNQGTLAGGIAIGQGEHPDAYLAGATNNAPGSCQNSNVTNTQLPYCFDVNVNIHNNAVTTNSSEGDELFTASPSGAGGVAFCTGADSYKFNNNWVCGNLTTGDGAGVSQLGFVWDGSIQHNAILFNQSTNPTTPTNGGGLLIMSAPDTDPTCPGEPDVDCNLLNGSVSDGIGRGLSINANLIMGNAAEAGAGGGLRLQGVNGIDVSTFPTRPDRWYSVNVTNNIIANNVSGWDGAGVSLQDSLVVNLVNNTIVDNDSTAASGVLFDSFFADQTSAPTPCPQGTRCVPVTRPQPAGVSSAKHSAEFVASLPGTITCPAGHTGTADNSNHNNSACRTVSFPILYNDVIWHNRAFSISVATPTQGTQQSTITVVPTLNQASTGQCVSSSNYWDIGFRGDTAVNNHSSGFTYVPQASFLTDTTGYAGGGAGFRQNAANPSLVLPYCNGSRVPPELGSAGYITLPGTNESNVPIPVFNLTAGATVDEGNNWVNINWGPLSLTHPVTGAVLGNYALAGGAAVGYVTPSNSSVTYNLAPSDDYFGNPRKNNNAVDVGAVEFTAPTGPAVASITGGPLTFSNVTIGTTSAAQTLTLSNTGGSNLTGITLAFSLPRFSRPGGAAGGTCTGTLAPLSSCTINVVFSPNAAGAVSGSLTVTANVAVTGSPVGLSGNGVRLSVSPTSLTFVTVGGLPQTQNVTIRNNALAGGGNTGPLTVGISGVTGGVSLTVSGNNCPAAGLAPGASCTVTVRFQASGFLHSGTGTLNVSDTEPASGTVSLSGLNVI